MVSAIGKDTQGASSSQFWLPLAMKLGESPNLSGPPGCLLVGLFLFVFFVLFLCHLEICYVQQIRWCSDESHGWDSAQNTVLHAT